MPCATAERASGPLPQASAKTNARRIIAEAFRRLRGGGKRFETGGVRPIPASWPCRFEPGGAGEGRRLKAKRSAKGGAGRKNAGTPAGVLGVWGRVSGGVASLDHPEG
jgi:hypothetical protein